MTPKKLFELLNYEVDIDLDTSIDFLTQSKLLQKAVDGASKDQLERIILELVEESAEEISGKDLQEELMKMLVGGISEVFPQMMTCAKNYSALCGISNELKKRNQE